MDPRIKELIKQMSDLGITRITYEKNVRLVSDRDIEIWWTYSSGEKVSRTYNPSVLEENNSTIPEYNPSPKRKTASDYAKEVVYVTKYGKIQHRKSDCKFLKNSEVIETNRREAFLENKKSICVTCWDS